MMKSIPHGGRLIDRVLRGEERDEALQKARTLKTIPLNAVNIADLEMIAIGAMSPLTGLMTRDDYDSVVSDMRLHDGLVWSLPITLAVASDIADGIREGEEVALVEYPASSAESDGHVLAIMRVEEKFTYDCEKEAREVYKTTDTAHPGVARLMAQGSVYLGGEIWLVNRPANRTFPEYRKDPAETRRIFKERGWKTVVGFQTRNPIHRAHEYIQKCAMEIVDGLLLHPLVGETKKDDISAELRMQSYRLLLDNYYPAERVVLSVFPAAMRYAGPREAIFHALCRKNYGCTHFIVGRDHAGVGNYYGTYDAQKIFEQFSPDEIGITPLRFEHSFFCRKCDAVVTQKTCPHDREHHVVLSGTQVRQMLAKGEPPPPEFTRPEVAEILIKGIKIHQPADDGPPQTSKQDSRL